MKKQIQILSVLILCVFLSSGFAIAKASKKQISGQLNLNKASVEELHKLPGLSVKKAEAIVDYRKEHPFKSVSELDQIKGFSKKSIHKMKPYLTTEGSNNLAIEGGSKSKSKKSKSKKEASAKKHKKADKA
ncbi:MAG: helix-hairpin-helix domain-containing protein [Deltaproteobacteria bacterium]|nr:helix-hairpin-helix domain-containing protein [Deltaproteobacteria bacterium]